MSEETAAAQEPVIVQSNDTPAVTPIAGGSTGASGKSSKTKRQVQRKPKEVDEIAQNELWREAIKVENEAVRTRKQQYACNVNMLARDHLTPKIGSNSKERELTAEESARAERILEDFGVKTTKPDPYKIEMPTSSNRAYGAYAYFAIPDEHRAENSKTMCEVTQYADTYYTLSGTTPYSRKK